MCCCHAGARARDVLARGGPCAMVVKPLWVFGISVRVLEVDMHARLGLVVRGKRAFQPPVLRR